MMKTEVSMRHLLAFHSLFADAGTLVVHVDPMHHTPFITLRADRSPNHNRPAGRHQEHRQRFRQNAGRAGKRHLVKGLRP